MRKECPTGDDAARCSAGQDNVAWKAQITGGDADMGTNIESEGREEEWKAGTAISGGGC